MKSIIILIIQLFIIQLLTGCYEGLPESTYPELTKKVNNAKDLVDLIQLRDELEPENNTDKIDYVTKAIQVKKSNLEIRNIGENIQFLFLRYSKIDTNKFKLTFVFEINETLKKDYYLYISGNVDKAYANRLKKDIKQLELKTRIDPEIKTSEWPVNKEIIVEGEISALEIPYNIYINFYYLDPEKRWEPYTKKYVSVGWYVDF